jgi:hypoxanthine phosphoribosyltransferase
MILDYVIIIVPMLQTLFTEVQIADRVRELADDIKKDHPGEHLRIIGILKGSMMFMSDLTRHLPERVSIDFLQVSSYKGEKSSSGVVQIVKDLDMSIEGHHVIIVEDIVDTGRTLSHLLKLWSARNPASIKIATLLDKHEAREFEVPVDYVGFPIPKHFVVGYGLDYKERFRNLPYIAQVVGDADELLASFGESVDL